MSAGLYVGVLTDYDPEDQIPEDEADGFILDPKEQLAAINHILTANKLPEHHEPETLADGAWAVGLSEEDFMEFIQYILHACNDEHRSECEFEHLMHMAPDTFVLPISFPLALEASPSKLPRAMKNRELPFQFIISAQGLQEDCREGARLLGLDPDSFPLLSADNAGEVWGQWTEILNARGIARDQQEMAAVCIKLYQATQQSLEKKAAIYFG